MKSRFTDDLKEVFTQCIDWAKLEIEYVKLTAAEKLIVLMTMLILGSIFLLLFIPVILMLLFALAQVFVDMMPVAVAYVSVAGIVILLLALLFIFRKPLIMNPLAKFISKLLLENRHNHNS